MVSAALAVAVDRAPRHQSGGDVCNLQTSERIVAIGDVHGAYQKFLAILREAGIIDGRRRWIAGRTHFVQTGDVVDRGPDSREVLDLLRKLEPEAERAGGRVHALLGNHEVMRMRNIRQDISEGEYDEFREITSEELRDRAYEVVSKDNADRLRALGQPFDQRAFRKQFYEETPLGSVEMQIAFAPAGEYGRWLREKNVMVKINGIVFLHGGISPTTAPLGCATINANARAELKAATPPAPEGSITAGADGPLWYRGLADGNPAIGVPEVDAILKAMDARAMVVGHTVVPDFKVRGSFDGRVIQIDTGMLNAQFFPGGTPSALEIAGETMTAIYEGKREVVK
jgi:hypothetical protein